MRCLLVILCLTLFVACEKEPVQVEDPQPVDELVEAAEPTIFDLVQEAKKLGIDSRKVNDALDDGAEGLKKLIEEHKAK